MYRRARCIRANPIPARVHNVVRVRLANDPFPQRPPILDPALSKSLSPAARVFLAVSHPTPAAAPSDRSSPLSPFVIWRFFPPDTLFVAILPRRHPGPDETLSRKKHFGPRACADVPGSARLRPVSTVFPLPGQEEMNCAQPLRAGPSLHPCPPRLPAIDKSSTRKGRSSGGSSMSRLRPCAPDAPKGRPCACSS